MFGIDVRPSLVVPLMVVRGHALRPQWVIAFGLPWLSIDVRGFALRPQWVAAFGLPWGSIDVRRFSCCSALVPV